MTAKKTEKHTKVVRGVKLLKNKHEELAALLEKSEAPEIHGDKVWFSSYFIMDYLKRQPVKPKDKVIEIGCGWGVLSIFLVQKYQAEVIAVDADKHVFPFLKLHARHNDVKVTTKVCRYENLKTKTLEGQDLITGGDICFWDELVDPLYKLIKKSINAGVKRIIIADPGRSPFLALAKKCKKKYGSKKVKLKEVAITEPTKESGYLLIIKQ